jgi:ABC-2 type transport system permease protein
MILNAVIAILSGAVFPINYIENNFFSAVRYLPFSYLAWYPAQIYLGKVNNNQIMQNIFICIIWIMILTFAVYIMWRKGVQRYAAFGG